MTTATSGATTVQVHRVYISVPAQRVWDALLSPEWTDRYGYGGIVHSDLTPGASFATEAGAGMKAAGVAGTVVDGEVLECDPPRRLVQTWRMYMAEELRSEGFTRLAYELHEVDGVTRLTVTETGLAEDDGPPAARLWSKRFESLRLAMASLAYA